MCDTNLCLQSQLMEVQSALEEVRKDLRNSQHEGEGGSMCVSPIHRATWRVGFAPFSNVWMMQIRSALRLLKVGRRRELAKQAGGLLVFPFLKVSCWHGPCNAPLYKDSWYHLLAQIISLHTGVTTWYIGTRTHTCSLQLRRLTLRPADAHQMHRQQVITSECRQMCACSFQCL